MAARKQDVEPLARDRIVDAAIRIIDAEGLDALSMRRLGRELGVNPMAAYHHIPSKSALYDLVLEAIMSGVDTSGIDPATPPAEQLKQAARAYRSAILRHRRAVPVFLARSLRSVVALRPVEPFLGILFAAGFTPDEALAAFDVVAHFILGGVVGHLDSGDPGTRDQRGFDALDATEFPHTSRLLAEGHYVGPDAEFEFGLDAMVHGLLHEPRRELEGGTPLGSVPPPTPG